MLSSGTGTLSIHCHELKGLKQDLTTGKMRRLRSNSVGQRIQDLTRRFFGLFGVLLSLDCLTLNKHFVTAGRAWTDDQDLSLLLTGQIKFAKLE